MRSFLGRMPLSSLLILIGGGLFVLTPFALVPVLALIEFDIIPTSPAYYYAAVGLAIAGFFILLSGWDLADSKRSNLWVR